MRIENDFNLNDLKCDECPNYAEHILYTLNQKFMITKIKHVSLCHECYVLKLKRRKNENRRTKRKSC